MFPPPISALGHVHIPLSGSASSNSRKGSAASFDDLFGDGAKENNPTVTTNLGEEEDSSKFGTDSGSVGLHLLALLNTRTSDVNANNIDAISGLARVDVNDYAIFPDADSHDTTPASIAVPDSSKRDCPSPTSVSTVSSAPVDEGIPAPSFDVSSDIQGTLGDALQQNQTVASEISDLPVFSIEARSRALACLSQSVGFYGLGSIQAQPNQVKTYRPPCPVLSEPQRYYGPPPHQIYHPSLASSGPIPGMNVYHPAASNMAQIHHHSGIQDQSNRSYLLPPGFSESHYPAPPTPSYSETSTNNDPTDSTGSRGRSQPAPGRPLIIVPQTGTDADKRKYKRRKLTFCGDSVSDSGGSKHKKAKKGKQ